MKSIRDTRDSRIYGILIMTFKSIKQLKGKYLMKSIRDTRDSMDITISEVCLYFNIIIYLSHLMWHFYIPPEVSEH